MAEGRATTIRFSSAMYQRLEEAGELTGLPINSIVVVACLEWLDAHQPLQAQGGLASPWPGLPLAPMQRHWKAPSGRRPVYPFDRFTDQAKHALTLAQEVAERAGKDYIDPVHVLIALADDRDSLAGRALASSGLEAEAVRSQLEVTGPPAGLASKPGVPTSATKRVIEAAFGEAKSTGDAHVGTGHLLLGLVGDPESGVPTLLERLGLASDGVRSTVLRLKTDNPRLG